MVAMYYIHYTAYNVRMLLSFTTDWKRDCFMAINKIPRSHNSKHASPLYASFHTYIQRNNTHDEYF